MPKTQTKRGAQERLRTELEAIAGVRRALVAGPPFEVDLICEPADGTASIRAAAHAVLAREGILPPDVELRVAVVEGTGVARRVRFAEITLERPRVGLAVARVTLDWNGKTYRETEEGEGGTPCELRVSARATMRAVEQVVEGRLHLDLVGVKAIRIFDHDLVAVLLRCREASDRRLIGVSIVSEDLPRATALAVLNATNRLLGNYLAT